MSKDQPEQSDADVFYPLAPRELAKELFVSGYTAHIANDTSNQKFMEDYAVKHIEAYTKTQVEQADTLDNHLKKHIPHDGKWRHVQFNIMIKPDGHLTAQALHNQSKGEV